MDIRLATPNDARALLHSTPKCNRSMLTPSHTSLSHHPRRPSLPHLCANCWLSPTPISPSRLRMARLWDTSMPKSSDGRKRPCTMPGIASTFITSSSIKRRKDRALGRPHPGRGQGRESTRHSDDCPGRLGLEYEGSLLLRGARLYRVPGNHCPWAPSSTFHKLL